MKTIQLNLYSFEELNDIARHNALILYQDININPNWRDYGYDDFTTICGCLGITVDKKSISYQGFYSQGEGSGFNADVNLPSLFKSIQKKGWRGYAPKLDFDFKLPDSDQRVIALLLKGKIHNDPKIIKTRNNCSVVVDLGVYPAEENAKSRDLIYGELDELEKWLDGIAQTLNQFLNKSLREQYEYITSKDAIAETIEANEYLFTADGAKANRIAALSINN
jgi:hypothetical protein